MFMRSGAGVGWEDAVVRSRYDSLSLTFSTVSILEGANCRVLLPGLRKLKINPKPPQPQTPSSPNPPPTAATHSACGTEIAFASPLEPLTPGTPSPPPLTTSPPFPNPPDASRFPTDPKPSSPPSSNLSPLKSKWPCPN